MDVEGGTDHKFNHVDPEVFVDHGRQSHARPSKPGADVLVRAVDDELYVVLLRTVARKQLVFFSHPSRTPSISTSPPLR